jgi:four helix bundle protein
LVLELYEKSAGFPKQEIYGLTSQLRRAAVSVPANIAEGCGRSTGADFARFLQIAMGSACELEYYLILARDLQFLSASDADALEQELSQIKRMFTSLARKVRG